MVEDSSFECIYRFSLNLVGLRIAKRWVSILSLGFETENRLRFSAPKWKLRIEIYYTLITRVSVTRAFF
jgi:hypothetical protein